MLHAQPFEPFKAVLSDNNTFDIRHPELAMVLQNNLAIEYAVSEEGFPTRLHTIAIRHIVHLEPSESVTR